MDLRRTAVLVLNAAYEPCAMIPARRAFILMAKGAAVMEAATEVNVHSGARAYLLPSVIRLTRYRHVPRRARDASRRQILLRDKHTCQYCGKPKHGAELTLDHVYPKSRGGSNDWQNLVASCYPCNNKKRDRTPEEAGMKLLRRPLPYTIFSSRFILREAAMDRPDWQKYLFYENTTVQ